MNEVPSPPDEGAAESSGPSGSFLSRAIWTLTSPKHLYEDIARGSQWWEPWVWVSLVSMVIAYISIPVQMQLVRLNPQGRPPEDIEKTVEAMQKFGAIGIVSTPVVILITALIVGGVSYLLVSLLAEESSFKKYFTLMLYANIDVASGQLIGTVLTRLKGVENIRSVQDATAQFGPALLASPDQKILYPVLSSLDVFYIWFYALLAAGLVHVFRMSTRNAVLVIIPVWLLQVLFALLGSRFGNA
jgi:hypothetical protein